MRITEQSKLDFQKQAYIFGTLFFERLTFLVFYIVIARKVTHDEYGFIVTVFAFLNILNSLFDFGLPFYLQRETAAGAEPREILLNSIFIRFLTIFLYTSLPLLYFWDKIENIYLVLLIIFINFIYGLGSIFQGVLNGSEKYYQNLKAFLISRSFLFLGFIVLFILTDNSLHYLTLIGITVLIQILFQLRNVMLIIKSFEISKIKFSTIKKILRSSLPIGAGLIFVITYDKIDVLLIEKFIDFNSVALYSVAYALYRNTSIFSGMILTKTYTDLSKKFNQSNRIELSKIKGTFLQLILISFVLILIFLTLPDILIKFFFGGTFIGSNKFLQYLAIGLPFIFLNNFTGVILNSIRREKLPMMTTAVAVLFNVTMNIMLIPKYGVFGAVWSTIATEFLVFALQSIIIFRLNAKTRIFQL